MLRWRPSLGHSFGIREVFEELDDEEHPFMSCGPRPYLLCHGATSCSAQNTQLPVSYREITIDSSNLMNEREKTAEESTEGFQLRNSPSDYGAMS